MWKYNDVYPNEIYHYGIPGMRWGHRKKYGYNIENKSPNKKDFNALLREQKLNNLDPKQYKKDAKQEYKIKLKLGESKELAKKEYKELLQNPYYKKAKNKDAIKKGLFTVCSIASLPLVGIATAYTAAIGIGIGNSVLEKFN